MMFPLEVTNIVRSPGVETLRYYRLLLFLPVHVNDVIEMLIKYYTHKVLHRWMHFQVI
jgi:hypothetical protein